MIEAGWTDLLASKTVNGSGSGEPYGLLTRLDATTTSEVRAQAAGTFDGSPVFKAWNALPERFRSRASWLMSVSVESQIRRFGATPVPSSYFTVDMGQEGIARLNGRPTLVTDYMPAYTGTTGTASICIVGSFDSYVIAMRQGLKVERVQHLFQRETAGTGLGLPTGQRGMFAWGRWGADAVVPGAFWLLNQTC